MLRLAVTPPCAFHSSVLLSNAVVCGNDLMAISLCDALKESGIRVPENIRITGYDASIEARIHVPPITTYAPSWKKLGAAAICRLLHEITGEEIECICTDKEALRPNISCGCPAAAPEYAILDLNYRRMEDNFVDSYLSTKLLAAGSLTAFVHAVYEMSYIFVEPSQSNRVTYSICLCEDWDQTKMDGYTRSYRVEGYSDRMILHTAQGERIVFDTAEMLPPHHRAFDCPTISFFSAVHFWDRCYGYAVLTFDNVADGFSSHYMRFCREVNSGLE